MSQIIKNINTLIELPTLIQQMTTSLIHLPNQAHCLNALRHGQIQFLNLGNLVYCQQQQLLLIFRNKYLYAYEQILPNLNSDSKV